VHLQVTGIAGAGFEAVSRMLQPLLKDETEGLVPTLFTGLRGVESAQIGLDLWNLARIAERGGMRAQLEGDGFDPADPGLPDDWREAYAAFVARHGHRGLAEMEASTVTWRRDPAPVVAMVRSYLAIPPEQAPPATLARQERERLQLTDDLAKRMNPLKRRGFRFVLGHAQEWVALRERTKSIIVRAGRIPDHFVPELQRRLVEAGVIEVGEDIFFLTNGEVSRFLREGGGDYRASVTRRRREYERNRHVVLPERFRGRPAPEPPAAAGHAGDVLTGTPVSPGVVTGRARVILDPSTDGPMLPGEVLVAPVTDAGWTPLFALASALVVDMGSALSHGSTVAREYGLPAVVNVRSGTRSIRTGDLVTVNGSKGTVTILGDGAGE
jgi:pyruvate,water dikinase